jgi:hypothetical protein
VFNVEELKKQLDERFENDDSIFYSWQCVSIVMSNFTIDFVIKDQLEMLVFLHVMIHNLATRFAPSFKCCNCLKAYKVMKFRMKLSYHAWILKIPINELVMNAIVTTLSEIKTMAIYQL